MPFAPGHKHGGRRKKSETKKRGNASLDTFYITDNRFKKLKKGKKYLDPELVDWYLNNGLDVSELYGEEEDWPTSDWYNDDGSKMSYYQKKQRDEERNKNM